MPRPPDELAISVITVAAAGGWSNCGLLDQSFGNVILDEELDEKLIYISTLPGVE
ncbi:MAG: hypothetical protein M3R68_05520 [Acidobacteriota bacterium]|nr:hypothetical protein [Acidobacteriota bacterium]